MNTTAKLNSSLSATANQDKVNDQTGFPQIPNRNFPNERKAWDDPDDYSDVPNGTFPTGFYADPNIDELSLLEFRLQEMQISYMKKKKYWEAKKEELLAAYPLQDTFDTPVNRTIKDVLQTIYAEIRALIAFPDSQLRYIYDRSRPQILKLGDTLGQACEKLNHPPENAGVQQSLEKAKTCLEVCNASITLLGGLGALINDVSREIKLCLKCQEIAEKTAVCVLNFAMTLITRIPLPSFDFNFGLKDLYRKFLFHSIHHETNTIETFVTGAKGGVDRASNKLNQALPSSSQEAKLQPIMQAPQQGLKPFFNGNVNKLKARVQNDVNQPAMPNRAMLSL